VCTPKKKKPYPMEYDGKKQNNEGVRRMMCMGQARGVKNEGLETDWAFVLAFSLFQCFARKSLLILQLRDYLTPSLALLLPNHTFHGSEE